MTATAPVYAHEQRILACIQCGAPLAVALEGGQFQCAYCGSWNQLLGRDESVDLQTAQQAATSGMSESERYERLREQDNKPLKPPESVRRFWGPGRLNEQLAAEALQQWNADRQSAMQGAPFTVQERLFYLTLALARQEADWRQRAFLESAIEAQPDERYRQILRCRLVRNAVCAWELDAAKAWLARCNPRSTDLITDTEYRLARCFIAVAEGDAVTLLNLLAETQKDVPIADGRDELAGVLRAHALALTGRQDEAKKQLEGWLLGSAEGFGRVAAAVHDHAPLALCRDLYPAMEKSLWKHIRETLTPAAKQQTRQAYAFMLAVSLLACLGGIALLIKYGDSFLGRNLTGLGAMGTVGLFAALLHALVVVPRDTRLRASGIIGMARLVRNVGGEGWYTNHYEIIQENGQVVSFEDRSSETLQLGDERPALLDPENTDWFRFWDPYAPE